VAYLKRKTSRSNKRTVEAELPLLNPRTMGVCKGKSMLSPSIAVAHSLRAGKILSENNLVHSAAELFKKIWLTNPTR